MKMAPVYKALAARGLTVRLVHTGQHYDPKMSEVFFEELGMPRPDAFLGVGSGSHADQTARVMTSFDAELDAHASDLVLVGGDVNSTVGCALVATKRWIAVGHVEAGLRSRDWRMPEEVNRVLTDHMSTLCLTPSSDGDENLRAEGVAEWRILRVGNCMIDSLRAHLDRARALGVPAALGLSRGSYVVVTLHRPSNVDEPAKLRGIMAALGDVAAQRPAVFPVHPRTRAHIESQAISVPTGLRLVEPMGYLAFLGLMAEAGVVLTDSGGIQEETTALGVPCLTLRDNTERPVTTSEGTNRVIGSDPARVAPELARILAGDTPAGRVPELWDGHAADRVADVVTAGFRALIDAA